MDDRIFKTEGDVNLTEARKRWVTELPMKTLEILYDDANSFIHQALSTPCLDVLTSCEGPYLITNTGRKILDFHGNNVHQVGYGHKTVIHAVTQMLQQLPFSPRRCTNPTAIELAKKLGLLVPGLNRVLFAPGGSEANSMALKLSRLVTGRFKTVSMWGAFHGAGLDAISVGGEAPFRKNAGPLLTGAEHIPQPSTYRSLCDNDPQQDIYVALIRQIFENEGDVGALIAETIRDTDVQIPVTGFWQKVRKLCDEFEVTLILDEIPISLGRTGKFFAFEHYGIVPDIVTIGKGLGGGVFPMAAILTSEKYNTVAKNSIGHFTHEKSPVGSAAALAVLKVIEHENLLARAQELGEIVKMRLLEMKDHYSIIGDVRGIGLLWGIDLVTDRDTKERAITEAEIIMYECLKNGLSFKVSQGNVITLSPPLIISTEELNRALDILEEAIQNIYKNK